MTTSVPRASVDFLTGVVVMVGLCLAASLAAAIVEPWFSRDVYRDHGARQRSVAGAEATKAGATSVLVTSPSVEIFAQCRDVCDDLTWPAGDRFVKLQKAPTP